MQNSKYTVIPARIPIPKNIEIGRLIGRDGQNLKPISVNTGTFISVNSNINPAQIEIKIKQQSNDSLTSIERRINIAKDQLNSLIKRLEKERSRRIAPSKKKENDIAFVNGNNRHATARYLKELESKKERKQSKREMNEEINSAKKSWNKR